MNILQVSENNIDELSNYILNKDISEHLKFYKLGYNSKYFETVKKYIFSQNSVSLIGTENNAFADFLIGKVVLDETLKTKVATVAYTIYADFSYYESVK